jgi:emfourin
MTRINFKRTGGVLGRETDSDFDLNEMPDDESQELQRLILDSNFFNIPQNMIGTATPDEYEYTVTVDAGNSHHTIHTSDSTASESLRPLLEKLSTLAKESHSNSPKK